jgi:hypothetical protein
MLHVHCKLCSLSLSLSSTPFLYHNHFCFLCFITDFSHIVSSPVQTEKISTIFFHCPACWTYDPGPVHNATPIFFFLYNTQNFPHRLHVQYPLYDHGNSLSQDGQPVTWARSSNSRLTVYSVRFPYHKPNAAFSTQDGIRGRLLSVDFSEVGNGKLLRNCGTYITSCMSSYPWRPKTSVNSAQF